MKTVYLVTIAFLLTISLYAQSENSRIISLSTFGYGGGPHTLSPTLLMSFDYKTKHKDTLAQFPCAVIGDNYVAIDAWNGRYFLFASDSEFVPEKLFTLNIKTGAIKKSRSPFLYHDIGQIEYDMFSNRLIFINNLSGLVKAINLENEKVDTLGVCSRSEIEFFLTGNSRCLDPIKQTYYSMMENYTSTKTTYLMNIDSRNGTTIKLDSMLKPDLWFWTFDLKTRKRYALTAYDDSGYVVSIDSNNVVDTLSDRKYMTSDDLRNAVFDPWNRKYIFPFYDYKKNKELLTVFDVDTHETSLIDFSLWDHLQRFYGAFSAIIKLADDQTMIATYGAKYQWYKCGFPIAGATEQIYVPSDNGVYTALVTFLDGRTSLSNALYFGTGIQQADDGCKLYPNPAREVFTIKTNCVLFNQVAVYDASGKLVLNRAVDDPVDTEVIDVKGLSCGNYYVNIKCMDGNTLSQKLILQ